MMLTVAQQSVAWGLFILAIWLLFAMAFANVLAKGKRADEINDKLADVLEADQAERYTTRATFGRSER